MNLLAPVQGINHQRNGNPRTGVIDELYPGHYKADGSAELLTKPVGEQGGRPDESICKSRYRLTGQGRRRCA